MNPLSSVVPASTSSLASSTLNTLEGLALSPRCQLVDLPTELRLVILRLCIPTSHIFRLNAQLARKGDNLDSPWGYFDIRYCYFAELEKADVDRLSWAVNVLCVNKQVSKEASQILYAENDFHFVHPGATHNFLKRIGRDNSHHLRKICIQEGRVQNGFAPIPFQLLLDLDAVHITKLILPPWMAMFPPPFDVHGQDLLDLSVEMARNLCARAVPLTRRLYQYQVHMTREEISRIIEFTDIFCIRCHRIMEDDSLSDVQKSRKKCGNIKHMTSLAASKEFRRRLMKDLRKPWNKRITGGEAGQ